MKTDIKTLIDNYQKERNRILLQLYPNDKELIEINKPKTK